MNHQSMRELTEREVRQLAAQALSRGCHATATRLHRELAARLMPSERQPGQQICSPLKN
jgi:hypothetical protein